MTRQAPATARTAPRQATSYLTAEWEAALDARLAMCSTSPVAVLNALLLERLAARR